MHRSVAYAFATLVLALAATSSCASETQPLGDYSWVSRSTSSPQNDQEMGSPGEVRKPAEDDQPERPAVFTILGGGDLLLHRSVNNAAATADGYNYSPLLTGLDAWVQGADLALCHLEVPLAPEGVAPSGYPLFGAPAQIIPALAEQGWNGCSTASNHSIDRGLSGLTATLDALDAAGLGHVGTARTQVEAEAPQLYELEREGRTITVAHLSITYGLNGLVLPADTQWAVNLIDVTATIARATAAREAGADLVVVSLHDGIEYRAEPSSPQIATAQALADAGVVDLIFGHHAHVPQRIELLPGGPGDKGMWVAYGMGNLISSQGAHCCAPETSNGLLITATVVAEPGGPARVTGLEWTGITVDRTAGYLVRVIGEAIANPAGGTLSPAELANRDARVRAVLGEAKERTTPPTPTGPTPKSLTRLQ